MRIYPTLTRNLVVRKVSTASRVMTYMVHMLLKIVPHRHMEARVYNERVYVIIPTFRVKYLIGERVCEKIFKNSKTYI